MMCLKEEVLNKLENLSKNRKEEISIKDIRPSSLSNVNKAAKRIIQNLKDGKKLLIVGDYDADGIMATTIFTDFLIKSGFKRGTEFDYIVPDRFVDGYGVSKNMINYAIDNHFNFIVTVDNGIAAIEAIDYACDNGIEVILTDHHTVVREKGKVILPKASVIVNPKNHIGKFPFRDISGSFVIWLVCSEINKQMKSELDMFYWVDLLGINVLSDVMKLESVNINLVKLALDMIKNKHRFIYTLFFDSMKLRSLTEVDISFAMIPAINAVGRLKHASVAIEAFLSKDRQFIKEQFKKMVEINNERKSLNDKLLQSISNEAKVQIDNGDKAIVIFKNDLHEGIVGILAGKLAEKYSVPAYVITHNRAKDIWKGSGRSTGEIDLYELTKSAQSHCIGFGGHKGAVGVAIHSTSEFADKIKLKAKKFSEEEFKDSKDIIIDINSLGDINTELVSSIREYAPFGESFRPVKFRIDAEVYINQSYKNGLHNSCVIIDNEGNSLPTWFFHNREVLEFNGKLLKNIVFECNIEVSPKYPNGRIVLLASC